MKRVLIRSEMVDFGTLPIVIKITPIQLYKSFEQYLDKPDSKITLEKISNTLCGLIPNFTEKDVQILYILYKIVVDGDIAFLSNTIKRKDWGLHLVKTRSFCLFLFLQNFRTSTTVNKMDAAAGSQNNQFNESYKKNKNLAQSFSPLNSPRSKVARSNPVDSSQNLINFVKSNLEMFLKIVCANNDFKTNESFKVSPSEFDLLSGILSLAEYGDNVSQKSLTELIPKDLDSHSVSALVEKALSTSEGTR
jgi:hypothetical protein